MDCHELFVTLFSHDTESCNFVEFIVINKGQAIVLLDIISQWCVRKTIKILVTGMGGDYTRQIILKKLLRHRVNLKNI